MSWSEKNKYPLDERLEIGFMLALVGGFLDAYTYVSFGGVFANAQTGNMVLLGIAIIDADFLHVMIYLIPILFFSLGIILTVYIIKHFTRSFLLWCMTAEVFVLFFIGFTPHIIPDYIITALISFICSIQMTGFKQLCGSPYSSTMCTGNLRSAMESLYSALFLKTNSDLIKCMRYLSVIVFFIFGAVIGTLSSRFFDRPAIFICCFLLIILLTLIMKEFYQSKQGRIDAGTD